MSSEACKLNRNGSNMFSCFQIRLGSWFESFGEFGFVVSPWAIWVQIFTTLLHWKISIFYMVFNFIMSSVHVLEFCVSYGFFFFLYLYMCFTSKKCVLFIICLVF
jgi:hypothetical protein